LDNGKSFRDFNISIETLRSLRDIKYIVPSEIQARALPHALNGENIIGQAKTGSGKTAVFAIAIIEKIDYSDENIQALVLSPTRELAIQVTHEMNRIGKGKGVKTVTIYGGQSIDIQFKKLRENPRVLVCTPGRLLDHMRRGTIKVDKVKTLVIDEADKMLEIGFIDDIEQIINSAPMVKQIMLFSATMPREIVNLADKYLKNPVEIKVSEDELSANHITQVAYIVTSNRKFPMLKRLLREFKGKKILIFTNTKKYGKILEERLKRAGYRVGYLSGDLSQSKRERTLGWFRKRGGKVLIASDVASRGLDIVDIDLVINFDFPRFDRLYIHRIGRTGRFGRKGKAISLITPQERKYLDPIKRKNRITIKNVTLR
jgi:ATP-dependent RNA helicase DeaD